MTQVEALERIASRVPGMLGYWDRDLVCRYANPAYERWFGKRPSALIGRHASEVLGEKLFALNQPLMLAALRGEAQHFERDIPDPHGGPTRVSLADYLPDVGAAGTVLGFVVMVSEITHQKRLETELRLRKEILRATVHNLPHSAAYVVDESLRYVLADGPLVKTIVGDESDKLVGRSMAESISPANRDKVMNAARLALDEGKSSQFELPFLNRAFDVSVQPIPGSRQVLLFVHEDSERVSRMLRLQTLEIHHRVKNNLQMISSLLSIQARLTPAAEGALLQSQSRVQSIALLHEHLYQSATVGSVSLDEYLPRVTRALRATWDDTARVDLEVCPVQLSLDLAVCCGLIVNELVTNALKYSGAKTVKVSLLENGGRLRLEVADDGHGPADPGALERRDTMGLTLVRDITRQLRGTISFDRRPGLRVVIDFPGAPA